MPPASSEIYSNTPQLRRKVKLMVNLQHHVNLKFEENLNKLKALIVSMSTIQIRNTSLKIHQFYLNKNKVICNDDKVNGGTMKYIIEKINHL